jgi:hypothetical protein
MIVNNNGFCRWKKHEQFDTKRWKDNDASLLFFQNKLFVLIRLLSSCKYVKNLKLPEERCAGANPTALA